MLLVTWANPRGIFSSTMNKTLRIISLASAFAVLCIPFVVSSSLFFPFITGKNFLFRIIVEIGFASWLLIALRDATYRPRVSALLWSVVVFVGVIGVANLFGENPWKSFWSNFERMEGWVTLLHLLAYFIFVPAILSTEKLWNRFVTSALGVSALVSLYSVGQLLGWFVINQGGVRVDATFGNATYLAIYLVFHIFIALVAMVRTTRIEWRISAGLLALLHIIILYHTATRGAILGLLGGLLVSALLIAIFDRRERRMRLVACGVVGAVALVVLGFFAIRDTRIVAESPVLGRFVSISWEDTKTQARAYVWPMAIEGWKERPILGWGQENFNYIFNTNYDPRMYRHELWFDRTHNAVLDWLVVGGILGLLTYLGIFVTALTLLWRRCPDLSFTEKALLTGLGAAYLFHNLFVFDNLTSYIAFFSVLGYIQFRSTRLTKPVAGDAEEVDDSETRIAGSLIVVLLISSLYVFVYRGYATASELLVALQAMSYREPQVAVAVDAYERALSYDTLGRPEVIERMVEMVPRINASSAPLEVKQRFFELAKGALETQLARYPGDARYELFAGSFYATYGMNDVAEKHLKEAVRLSPKKQAMLFQLGSFYLGSKQYDRAVELFEQAYRLDESYDSAATYYTASLIYAGKEKEAKVFFASRFPNRQMTDDSIVRAYADLGNWRRVIETLRTRIAANPATLDDRMSLVGAYLQVGERQSAISVIREIITLNPQWRADGEAAIKEIEAGRTP